MSEKQEPGSSCSTRWDISIPPEYVTRSNDQLTYSIRAVDDFETDLDTVLGKLKELLVSKNTAYGDSALNPIRFHSQANPIEQLNVRMDDKLSRMTGGRKAGEDTPKDYVGYWVLREIALMREERKKF